MVPAANGVDSPISNGFRPAPAWHATWNVTFANAERGGMAPMAPNKGRGQNMANLKLKTLRCIRKQDITGKDEPRIKVDGRAVWNGVVSKDGSVDIGVEIAFTDEASVIAEEMNNTKPKQIGDAVLVRETGNPKFMTFKTSGCWYEVDFEVTASASTSPSASTASR